MPSGGKVCNGLSIALLIGASGAGCVRTLGIEARGLRPARADPFPYVRAPVEVTFETAEVESDAYASFEVSYPARDSSDERNRVVRALLRVPHGRARGLVVVLPILGGDYGASDLFACDLTEHGFSTLRYERKADAFEAPGGLPRAAHLMGEAVVDVRRGLDWVKAGQVPGSFSIGLIGISMGSFVATLIASSDARIDATVLALGGGDLPRVLRAARSEEEIEAVLSSYEEKGMSDEAIDREIELWLGPYEPLRHAARLDPRRTLMVQARFDEVVPFARGTEVWIAAGRPARAVLPTGHYSSVWVAPYLMGLVRGHFERTLRSGSRGFGSWSFSP